MESLVDSIPNRLSDPLALLVLNGTFREGATAHVSAAPDGSDMLLEFTHATEIVE